MKRHSLSAYVLHEDTKNHMIGHGHHVDGCPCCRLNMLILRRLERLDEFISLLAARGGISNRDLFPDRDEA